MKSIGLALLLLFLLIGLTTGTAEVTEFLSLENLAVPESLGKVESKFKGRGDRWVVHIQDVHTHLTAQQNISALADHLHEVYGIQTLAIEGGWGITSLPKSWALPSTAGKQNITQALLEEAYITGPIYSAIFSKQPTILVGLEDAALYEKNRQLYLKFLENRETTLEKIHVLQGSIQAKKENIYNPELLEFDQVLSEFRQGRKAEAFIPLLLKSASAQEIDLQDLPQIQIFQKALSLEKSIDREKLEGEAKRLMKTYKYAQLHFEELLQSGKIPADQLEHYPQTQNYLELMKIQEEMASRLFFEEIETAIERLKAKLLHTTEEKNLDKRAEVSMLAGKIISLQATPADLKAFKAREIDFQQDLQKSALEEVLQNGLDFYETAQKRDTVFFEKIKSDPNLQGSIALVTGGFHTDGLTEHLEQAGISYVVVSPSLGKEPEAVNEALYFERLRESLPSTQAMSEHQSRVFQESFDPGLVKAVEIFNGGDRDVRRGIDIVTSYQNRIVSLEAKTPDTPRVSGDILDSLIRDALDVQKASKRITLIIRQSVLETLLDEKKGEQATLALKLWRNVILPNNKLTIVLIQDRDRDHTFTNTEGEAVFKTAQGTVAEVAKRELSKLSKKERDVRIGVIDPDYQSTANIISLEPEPEALIVLQVLLANPKISINAANDLLERTRAMLFDLEYAQAVQTAA